jgi:Uncharacterized protein conserved in bacteria
MKCPIDQTDLKMSERQGIEIDYCPKCRGVWLDRGELDKLIERSAEAEAARRAAERAARHDDDDDYDRSHDGRRRKHKSFFEELFDF